MTTPVDHASLVGLLTRLVRLPSRGGIDPSEPILDLLAGWFCERGLPTQRILDPAGAAVGVVCTAGDPAAGRHLVLNACIDTAPFGDESRWRSAPTSAHIEGDWLFGRGSADSKAAVAVFAHLVMAAHIEGLPEGTRLSVLFDADEHTGGFAGARRYFEAAPLPSPVDGVMIGYPGQDSINVGARGFLRAEFVVHGTGGHSGSSRGGSENAVEKAGLLITLLGRAALPEAMSSDFPLAAKLTVTEVHGGDGYAIIPDRCTVGVDVRLTPAFAAEDAQRLLHEVRDATDAHWATRGRTQVRVVGGWPAYRLPARSPLSAALTRAAAHELGHPVEVRVVGPSNIANYLASLGIPATCGFGVRYQNLHAPDECIDLTSLPPTYRTYRRASHDFLANASPSD